MSWVNWKLDEEQLALVDFFRHLTALFHFYPVLPPIPFFHRRDKS